jgi:hypothetical protein
LGGHEQRFVHARSQALIKQTTDPFGSIGSKAVNTIGHRHQVLRFQRFFHLQRYFVVHYFSH